MSPRRGSRRVADTLLRGLVPREREEVLADMDELRRRRESEAGRLRVMLWYWWELIRYAMALNAGGNSLWRDLRFAVRSLLRTPGVTFVAIPTLALAIAATTAVFSFADALIFRPPDLRDPGRLLSIYHLSTTQADSYSSFSYLDFTDFQEADLPLAGVAAYNDIEARLGEEADATPVEGQIVSGSYFFVLGVPALLGRTFLPEEDLTPGTHPVLVLSEDLWVRRFGRDPSIIGKTITLNARPFTVVGVMPRAASSVEVASRPLFWVPLMMHDVVMPDFGAYFYRRGAHWLNLVGRIAPGADPTQVRRALEALALRQAEAYPETNQGWSIGAVSLTRARRGLPGASPVPRLTAILAVVVGMVLLIACANVANLLLARATVRSREMGIRVAIGAGRLRLMRQLLTEALVLALAGGIAGVLLAWWAVSVLPSLGSAFGLAALDARIDLRVLFFALGVTLSSAVLFGLVPALRASTSNVVRSGSPSDSPASGRARGPLGHLLVGVQVALSLVLLVGAGLTLRTLWNLYAVPLGFDAATVRIAQLDLSHAGYPAAGAAQAQRRLLDAARQLPGVRSASLAEVSLFGAWRMANDILWESGDSAGGLSRTNVGMNVVAEGYFNAMGIPIVAGRDFNADDVVGGPGVAVVNEALATRLWPGRSALGRRFWSWGGDAGDTPLTVVGVVANGRYYRSWRTADRPFVFLPLSQNPQKSLYLYVRGAGPTTPSPQALIRALRVAEPRLLVPSTRLLAEAQASSMTLERTSARLLSLFGALAGLIAVMGIYGVVSFNVSRRTREIGVRMALGARAPQVRRAVVGRSAIPILVGAVVGGGVALALSHSVSSLLYGVGPRDPVTFAVVAALLVGVGLLASALPARRATRVDPVVALRTE